MFTIEWSVSFILKGLWWAFVQYNVISAAYNVFFHPLKHYPGPRLLAASRIPIIGAVLLGRSTAWVAKLHVQYGPVVRVAPNWLSYANSSAWKEIYGSTPTRPTGLPRDSAFWRAAEDEQGTHSILSANDQDHARIRRVYARALSERAVSVQEPLIAGHVDRLIEKIQAEHGNPLDLVDMFNFTIFDIIGDLQFGESLHLLDDTTYRPLVKSYFGLVRSVTLLAAVADSPLVEFLLRLIPPKLIKAERDTWFGMLNERLNKRLNAEVKRPDLVHFVMESGEEGHGLSEGELRATAQVIMLAGTETTSTALSGFMAHMLDAPELLKQLQDEIRSTFQQGSAISFRSMREMPLLNACIKESLRVYPSLPGELPRRVPSPGALISGQWVPGGSRVYVTPLAAFRSPTNFCEAGVFSPQRWYKNVEAKFSNDDLDVFKPFSVGTRDCIGQYLAQYIMSLVICKLLLHFDFEQCPQSISWFSNQKIWSIWDKPPLMAKCIPADLPK